MSDAPVSFNGISSPQVGVSTSAAILPPPQRVLLVEPDVETLTRRTLRLTSSNYVVITARNRYEVLGLRRTEGISLAILSDALGSMTLQGVAMSVRKQWPLARILILKSGQSALEDNLYDEMVDHQVAPQNLLDTLVKLSEDRWNQRKIVLGFRPEPFSKVRPAAPYPIPSESDPTKQPRATQEVNTRTAPAGESKIQR
jgi:hypothetical protein